MLSRCFCTTSVELLFDGIEAALHREVSTIPQYRVKIVYRSVDGAQRDRLSLSIEQRQIEVSRDDAQYRALYLSCPVIYDKVDQVLRSPVHSESSTLRASQHVT
jgi:hypothetical protein